MYENTIEAERLIIEAEKELRDRFLHLDDVMYHTQRRVLTAFTSRGISASHFLQTNGYGYDDIGRDTLDAVFAITLESEDALVRPQFVSGTHAITVALNGLLESGDTLLYASGKPYDTLEEVIGLIPSPGSLLSRGIHYKQVDLNDDYSINIPTILDTLTNDESVRVVAFQRSAGYAWRIGISPEKIGQAIQAIHAEFPNVRVFVDNCYGELADYHEPTFYGADLIAGSLIKNMGGGIAPTGGYIAGKRESVERASFALTAPGIGRHCGSFEQGYRLFYQGLFNAPTVVNAALKTAELFATVFSNLGYSVMPSNNETRTDIIQAIKFGDREGLLSFCRALQSASPIDSLAVPEPSAMPGYHHEIIMAAGAFVQGSSIELSADGPLCEPFIAYLQGGLNYAHGRLACIYIANAFI